MISPARLMKLAFWLTVLNAGGLLIALVLSIILLEWGQ